MYITICTSKKNEVPNRLKPLLEEDPCLALVLEDDDEEENVALIYKSRSVVPW